MGRWPAPHQKVGNLAPDFLSKPFGPQYSRYPLNQRALFTIVASLIVERPLCLACIAHKSGASQLDALRAIEQMGLTVSLNAQHGERCRACGSTVEPVYSLSARAERPG
jgi:hypothetical protein